MDSLWYWLDGQVAVGPISFRDLSVMVRNGILTERDLVRSHGYPEWQTTESVEGLFEAARQIHKEPIAHDSAWPDNPRMPETILAAAKEWHGRHESPAWQVTNYPPTTRIFSGVGDRLRDWIQSSYCFTGGILSAANESISRCCSFVWCRKILQVLVLLVVVGVSYSRISAIFLKQHQVYSYLTNTMNTLKELRIGGVDDVEWADFADVTQKKLRTFVPRLEAKVNIRDPASLSLLAIARDYLPALLREERGTSSEFEQKIDWHLRNARESLDSYGSYMPSDYWGLGVLAADAILLFGTTWYFCKGQFIRRSSTASS